MVPFVPDDLAPSKISKAPPWRVPEPHVTVEKGRKKKQTRQYLRLCNLVYITLCIITLQRVMFIPMDLLLSIVQHCCLLLFQNISQRPRLSCRDKKPHGTWRDGAASGKKRKKRKTERQVSWRGEARGRTRPGLKAKSRRHRAHRKEPHHCQPWPTSEDSSIHEHRLNLSVMIALPRLTSSE